MTWYTGDIGRVVKADRKTRYPDRRGAEVVVIREGKSIFNGEPSGFGPFDTGATRSLPEGVLEVRDLTTGETFRCPRGWMVRTQKQKVKRKAKAVAEAFEDEEEDEMEKALEDLMKEEMG